MRSYDNVKDLEYLPAKVAEALFYCLGVLEQFAEIKRESSVMNAQAFEGYVQALLRLSHHYRKSSYPESNDWYKSRRELMIRNDVAGCIINNLPNCKNNEVVYVYRPEGGLKLAKDVAPGSHQKKKETVIKLQCLIDSTKPKTSLVKLRSHIRK